MGTKIGEALEKLGGGCPVCGNSDLKKVVIGSKKLARNLEQIFFFCLVCRGEISKESGKMCIALISKVLKEGTKEVKYVAKIEFQDLGSFIAKQDPNEMEANRVLSCLTALNIPLYGPPPSTGNE